MSSNKNNSQSPQRAGRFEEFESRIVMSAQAVASVLPDLAVSAEDSISPTAEVASFSPATTTSSQASGAISPTTAAAQLAQQYGLDGTGQTIAVIDTGIAFDHVALGGGFGEGSRVVGGYDFAEGDANPYDDGPTGFHGTHVAGIIGSTDLEYTGLAPGADLVALRVFDDAGRNELEWVEQALQWVHDNQFSFENPITTINLSLGTTPDEVFQEVLEDELAQLKEDGIFISVAAGNHFDQTAPSQLAYPASSSSVVPVASHTSTGALSDFSQRAQNVLVAPGQGIVSTVPEHLFFGTREDPFVGASGTSQAAPYVAGASALLRQAYHSVGIEDVNQDLLYNQLLSTADQVFDEVTGANYSQVNLQSAIESVLGGEQSLSSNGAQTGSPSAGGENESTDPEPAEQTQQSANVNLTDGVLLIEGDTGSDAIELRTDENNNHLTVNINGNTSTFAVDDIERINIRGNGGNDALNVSLANTDDTVKINHRRIEILNDFFRLEATDISQAEIDNGGGEDDLRVRGSDFGDQLSVSADEVRFSNIRFEVEAGSFASVYANGGSGDDTVQLNGTAGDDVFAEREKKSILRSDQQRVLTEGFESVSVTGGGGSDQANLIGTDQRDDFSVDQQRASVTQNNRQVDIDGFARINVIGAANGDAVSLTGSNGDDILYTRDGSASLVGDRFLTYVSSFERLEVNAGGGNDTAYLSGSAGDDHFRFQNESASLATSDSVVEVNGFDLAVARPGSGGHDTASFIGSAADETYFANETLVQSSGDGLATGRTIGFDQVAIDGRAGNDAAFLRGGDGSESLTLSPDDVEFETTLQMLRLVNVQRSHFDGGDGEDRVDIGRSENLDLIRSLGDGAQAVLQRHTAVFVNVEQLEADAVDGALADYDLETVDLRFNLNRN